MSQTIFVINSGSSSLKFQLIEMPTEKVSFSGIFERIGAEQTDLSYKYQGEKYKKIVSINNHQKAVDYLLKLILKIGVIKSLDDIDGIGHRVAHGGAYTESKLITEEVIDVIIKMSSFAPSHNPVNAVGIKAFQKALPKIGQVAVFDTSFHQTIEEEHFIYP